MLNNGGNDAFIDYAGGVRGPEPGVHPPVNFHAYAAATRGAFCDATDQVLTAPRFSACLVLIRHKPQAALEAVRRLKGEDIRVFVAWKECGQAQLANQLAEPKIWGPYAEILRLCDGVVSPTLVPPPVPANLEIPPFHPIPTPYPVDLPDWNHALPLDEREGIFLGTREFFIPSRNHLAALTAALRVARTVGAHVTAINTDGGKGKRLLSMLETQVSPQNLRVVTGKLGYADYLELIARHRVVFQLDRSFVPGQVAGDALLCRSICVGGNSAVEQLAFPEDCAQNLAEDDAEVRLEELLTDDSAWREASEASQQRAAKLLSFKAVAKQLGEIID